MKEQEFDELYRHWFIEIKKDFTFNNYAKLNDIYSKIEKTIKEDNK
jgi:hypothetical protein